MKVKTAKVLGVAVIALLLAGCGAKAQETPESDNSGVQSEADSSGDISASSSEATADKELISEDEAKDIALKDAGLTEEQVSGLWCKLDTDDGVQQYEVEFYADGNEYDYEVDAASGNILSKKKELEDDREKVGSSNTAVTEEQARKIALEKVPGAGEKDIRIHQDTDDGKVVYEGSVVYQEKKYEFEIDADSGKLLEWEEESVS